MPSKDELLAETAALRARRNNVRPRELMALAVAAGRVEANRGKHRVFEKAGRPPLPIPDHARTMAARTALKILETLEEDIRGMSAGGKD